MENRNAIRQRIRDTRRAVTVQTQVAASQAICRRLHAEPSFAESQNIAGFLAFDGEPDPMELMKAAEDLGKRVYVPTIVAKSQPLMFVPWSMGCPMTTNHFGILEPRVSKTKWIAARELEFVITPLVAFDQHCNRIGVGGGYYDRSFAHLNDGARGDARTQLMGFAYELQKVSTIETAEWDVVLDIVATESAVYRRPKTGDKSD